MMTHHKQEKDVRIDGFRIRSWSDLVAVTTLMLLAVAGLSWGLKLEFSQRTETKDRLAEVQVLRDRVHALELKTDAGILPLTSEKIANLTERTSKLEQEVKDLHEMDSRVLEELDGGPRVMRRK